MEQAQFEQAVLQMVHNEGADRLTPGAVAHQLRVTGKDAERMLDKMVTNGALELDSDDDGNLFYFVPGIGSAGVFTAGTSAAQPAEIPKPQPRPPYGAYPPQQQPGGQWGTPYGAPPRQPAPPPAPPHPGARGAAPAPQYGNPAPYGAYAPPTAPTGAPAANPYASGHPQPPYGYPQPPGPTPGAAAGAPSPYGGQVYQGGSAAGAYGQQPFPPQGAAPYGQGALVPVSGANAPKSPAAASVLSAFFPGAGQLYNGHVGKGLGFFFAWTMLAAVSPPLVIIPWMWSVADAYAGARQANQQQHYGLLNP